MDKKERLRRNKQRLAVVLYGLLALSVAFALVRFFQTPSGNLSTQPGGRTRADYALMVAQCLLGMVVIYLPTYIEKKKNIDIPDVLEFMYLVFLFCAIYLGEVRNFYHRIPYWDTILHTMSGGMLAVIGFYIVYFLNNWDKVDIHLSPFFVAFFAFCFAAACGMVWEVYEFALDNLLGFNMQKYMTETGEMLIGAAALRDTMMDIVVDLVGALTVCVVSYFSMVRKREGAKEIDAK